MQPSMDIVVLIYGTGDINFEKEVLALKKLAVSENCVLNLGGSRIHKFPEELESAWTEARLAADHLTGTGIFAIKEYEPGMNRIYLKENLQMENALRSSVILGNIVSVEDLSLIHILHPRSIWCCLMKTFPFCMSRGSLSLPAPVYRIR